MVKKEQLPIIEVNLGIAAEFKAHVIRSDGSIRHVHDWQKNLITNGGMNKVAGGAGNGGFMSALRVGSGTTAPAFTDTTLVAHVASTGADGNLVQTGAVAADANPSMTGTQTFTFAVGAAAGNLTELGMAGATTLSGYPLYTRALFKDGSGNPITIVVGADEQLVVTYVVRIYIPKTPSTAVLLNAGNNTEYTISMLPMEVDSDIGVTSMLGPSGMYGSQGSSNAAFIYTGAASGTLGPIDGEPTGTRAQYAGQNITLASYVADSYRRDVTYAWALGSANLADMGAFSISTSNIGYYSPCRWQWTVSPKITKTNVQTLSFTHRYSLARA